MLVSHAAGNKIGSAFSQLGWRAVMGWREVFDWRAVMQHFQEVRVCIFSQSYLKGYVAPCMFCKNSSVMHSYSCNHFLSQTIHAKHELLLSAPPAATFDCGALYDPLLLLSALEHASSSPSGSAFYCTLFAFLPVGWLLLGDVMLSTCSACYASRLA